MATASFKAFNMLASSSCATDSFLSNSESQSEFPDQAEKIKALAAIRVFILRLYRGYFVMMIAPMCLHFPFGIPRCTPYLSTSWRSPLNYASPHP